MTLSRNDTAFLKGIAILMIVMHNFCHWLPGCVVENEYTFDASRIGRYLDYFTQGGPHLVLNFFSHYGHYGVPLFLFLSGYGLVKKYESTKTKTMTKTMTALAFIWQHAVKLWRLMLPALLIYWLCTLCFGKPWTTKPTDLLAMVTYTANLFYQRDLILGPWWFFSLILQLYIIYRLLLYPTRNVLSEEANALRRHGVLVAVMLVCFALQGWLYYFDVRMTPDWHLHLHDTHPRHWDLFNYCRYNFPGSMLPFGLGILWAREEKQRAIGTRAASSDAARTPHPTVLWTLSIGGFILLLLSAFHSMLWMLSPIFLLLALVPLAPLTQSPLLRKPLEWTGTISATLFALHPIVRAFTIRYAKQAELQGEWFTTCCVLLLYVAISLAAAWLLSWLLKPRNPKT